MDPITRVKVWLSACAQNAGNEDLKATLDKSKRVLWLAEQGSSVSKKLENATKVFKDANEGLNAVSESLEKIESICLDPRSDCRSKPGWHHPEGRERLCLDSGGLRGDFFNSMRKKINPEERGGRNSLIRSKVIDKTGRPLQPSRRQMLLVLNGEESSAIGRLLGAWLAEPQSSSIMTSQ